jgi:hypothetical protein
MSNLFRILKLAVALAAGAALATVAKPAAADDAKPTRSIVLVHGAFADGSSWDRVTPILMLSNPRQVAAVVLSAATLPMAASK